MRQKLLLPFKVRMPRLTHRKVQVWDTLAIAGYLNKLFPEAGLYPTDVVARAHCRAISGEMHAGFHNPRSALPMNIKARHETSRSSLVRARTWRGCWGSGPSALRPAAGFSCSGRPAWPMPCSRRSAPGFAHTR
ncbi:hypothetical protein [Salipiger pallidus]|nr:hypothetical protein [Salipiger pallidus]